MRRFIVLYVLLIYNYFIGLNLFMKKYIISAKRSAIGKFLGSLYEQNIVDVSTQLIKKGFDSKLLSDVEEVILGNVYSSNLGQAVARTIAIKSGCGKENSVPAYSINEVCGSGMQAVINACHEIEFGKNLVMAGGIEFMSNVPYATESYLRLGQKNGNFSMADLMIKDGLVDNISKVHMGVTAENIAKKYNISREKQDEYSWMSQHRTIDAIDTGKFKDEIVPLELKDYRNRPYLFDTDEFPNRESTKEKMSSLKPSFVKDGTGTLTPANTSGVNDGVSFLLIASEDYCKKNNIKPIVEIVDSSVIACDPQLMGLGPYYAIKDLLTKTKIDFKSIDYFEINEAFAAQALGSFGLLEKEYSVDEKYITDRCNIYGSGLGLGHPLGCTGSRIVTTLSHIMNNNKCTYGIASLCIGGGMGAAVLLKKVG